MIGTGDRKNELEALITGMRGRRGEKRNKKKGKKNNGIE